MPNQNPSEIVDAVLARHHDEPTRLLQILRETHEALGWLPGKALLIIACGLLLPLARVEGVAGFTTGLKWEACRNAPGAESKASPATHYLVCNADEGEPGTFKNRMLLTTQADLLFEDMTVAVYAVGARRGLLYTRGEYRYLGDPLKSILERRRDDAAAHLENPAEDKA